MNNFQMNNFQMYELAHPGGTPYPETDRYYHDRWYTTTGLTDVSEYKTLSFNIRQDSLLPHWQNAYIELKGKLVKKIGWHCLRRRKFDNVDS